MFDFINAKDASYISGKFNRMKDINNFRHLTGFLKSFEISGILLFVGMSFGNIINMILQFKEHNKR